MKAQLARTSRAGVLSWRASACNGSAGDPFHVIPWSPSATREIRTSASLRCVPSARRWHFSTFDGKSGRAGAKAFWRQGSRGGSVIQRTRGMISTSSTRSTFASALSAQALVGKGEGEGQAKLSCYVDVELGARSVVPPTTTPREATGLLSRVAAIG